MVGWVERRGPSGSYELSDLELSEVSLEDDQNREFHEVFSGYWCGYRDNGKSTPLNCVPGYIDTIPLAFAGLNKNSTMTTDYLCTDFRKAEIQRWSQELRSQGQKVTMSLMDSEAVHWWDVDLEKYARSCQQVVMEEWGLDGFDIDGEGPAIDRLREFVPMLRQVIGEDPVITYTCYTGSDEDTRILDQIKNDIDWVQLMTYDESFEGMVQLAEHYAKIIGKEKIVVGVKAGVTSMKDSTRFARWVRENGYRGMMLWSTDMDNPSFTGKKIWSWAEAVKAGLNRDIVVESTKRKGRFGRISDAFKKCFCCV